MQIITMEHDFNMDCISKKQWKKKTNPLANTRLKLQLLQQKKI